MSIEYNWLWLNSDFNRVEFDAVKNQSGSNAFVMTHFIHQGLAQAERLKLLNQTAIQQMKLLLADAGVRRLEGKQP